MDRGNQLVGASHRTQRHKHRAPAGAIEERAQSNSLPSPGSYWQQPCHPGGIIRKTSLKVEIRADSPVFVVTKPLKIDYTRKD